VDILQIYFLRNNFQCDYTKPIYSSQVLDKQRIKLLKESYNLNSKRSSTNLTSWSFSELVNQII
jgi:hypothetical protein